MEKSYRISLETRINLCLTLANDAMKTSIVDGVPTVVCDTTSSTVSFRDKNFSLIGETISITGAFSDDESFIKSYNKTVDALNEKLGTNYHIIDVVTTYSINGETI